MLMERIANVKEELRYLKESKPRDIMMEDPEQDRIDQIELDISIKYTKLEIAVTNNGK
jgi:hypothetical protein